MATKKKTATVHTKEERHPHRSHPVPPKNEASVRNQMLPQIPAKNRQTLDQTNRT